MRDPVTLLSIVDVTTIDPEVQKVIGHVTKGGSTDTVPAIFYVGKYFKKRKFSTAMRIMLVTTNSIITYREDGTMSRCVSILAINEVFVFPDMFNVLSVPTQHDFLFQLERPADIDYLINILQVLKKAYEPDPRHRALLVSSFSGSHTICPKVDLAKKGKEAYPAVSTQIPFIKAVSSEMANMDAILRPPKPPKEDRGEVAVKEINARIGAVLTHPLFYPPNSDSLKSIAPKPSVETPQQANEDPKAAPLPISDKPASESPNPQPAVSKPVHADPVPAPTTIPQTPARQQLDAAHAPSISRSSAMGTPGSYGSATPSKLTSPPPPPPPTPGPQQGYNHRIRVYTPLPSSSVRHVSSPPRQSAPPLAVASPFPAPSPSYVAPPVAPTRPSMSAFESGIAGHDVSMRITIRQQAIDSRRGEVSGLMGLAGIQNILLVATIQEELEELLQSQSKDRTVKYNMDMEEEQRLQAASAAVAAAEADARARAAAEHKANQEAEEAAAKEIEAALLVTPARPTAPQVDPSTPEYAQWYYTQYLPFVSKMQTPVATPGRKEKHRH